MKLYAHGLLLVRWSATVAVSAIYICMHACAHEAVHLLHTTWAERMIETRKLVMRSMCCTARLRFTQALTSHVAYF